MLLYILNTARCQWKIWSTCLVEPLKNLLLSMIRSQGKLLNYFLHCFFSLRFPREDEGSPRQAILAKFCPTELSAFRGCMVANPKTPN